MAASIRDVFKRPSVRALLLFAAVYAVAMAVIFWGTWSLDRAPIEPDNATSYPLDYLSRWVSSLLSGGSFVPGDLRNFIGSPYFWQELQYAVPCFLAAWALVFYLRGRGLSLVAAYGAGAAYGLMGYNITLFSAGHLGWFVWLTYGPFAFGLIDRSVRKGRWSNWILLGAVLAWGAARQADLWLIFTVLSLFYGLWCVAANRKFASLRMWGGVLVTGITFFACGLPQVRHALFSDLASRDKQIAGASGKAADAEAASPSKERTKEEEAKRWDFCTSWSLPPDEVAEFFFGASHGDSSDPRVSPVNRYKGRIGQRVTIPEGQRARDPSSGRILSGGDVLYIPYRQHSLYFGFITCLLALAGVFSPLLRRSADRDVWFWTAMGVLFFMCALGGFTPFYRLVYALPAGDYLRCPVKFVHVLELCAAALAGFGIQALLDAAKGRGWAKGAACALVVFALVNVADLVRVDRRYLAVEDVSFFRAPNGAADVIRKDGGGKVFFAIDPSEGRDMIAGSFGTHLVQSAESAEGADVRFVLATQRGLASAPALAEKLRSGKLKMVGAVAWQKGKGIYMAPQNAAAAALFRVDGVEPPKPEPPPESNRMDRFLTWLSIAATFAALAIAIVRLRPSTSKNTGTASGQMTL